MVLDVFDIFIAGAQMGDKAIALHAVALVSIARCGAGALHLLGAIAAHDFFGLKAFFQADSHFLFARFAF